VSGGRHGGDLDLAQNLLSKIPNSVYQHEVEWDRGIVSVTSWQAKCYR